MTSVSARDRGEFISYEDYLDRILTRVQPLAPVQLPLAQAAGRRTAEPVLAAAPAPAFTNSAMDGFGVRAADLARAAGSSMAGSSSAAMLHLPVSGDIAAGTTGVWEPGRAVRIMTGAPVPAGVDTVIPVEFTDHPTTRAPLPARVALPAGWPPGRNIRVEGSDVGVGEEILPAGTTLDGAALAALAGVGVSHVRVSPQVQVGIVVTGDEVVTSDQVAVGSPGVGQVLDSNTTLIAATLPAFGAAVVRARTSSDDPGEFTAIIDEMLAAQVDLLLTTGGASVGAHDVARHVLSGRGVDFASVGIQPAKPQGFGIVGGVPVCALPGNPGAVHASLHAIVRPVLAALGHLLIPAPTPMVVQQGWTARLGMRQFVPVRIAGEGISPVIPGGVAAHRVRSLALAEGLASVAPEIAEVGPGDVLPVLRTR